MGYFVHMNDSKIQKLTRVAILLGAGVIVSACVSDTLSSVDTTPKPLAAQKAPSYDPVQREQAIKEIRAKAEQPSSGELTSPFAAADGPNRPLNAEEQARKITELQNTAAQNNAVTTDAELAEKQRSIRELQQKAQSHYGNAVGQIKN